MTKPFTNWYCGDHSGVYIEVRFVNVAKQPKKYHDITFRKVERHIKFLAVLRDVDNNKDSHLAEGASNNKWHKYRKHFIILLCLYNQASVYGYTSIIIHV